MNKETDDTFGGETMQTLALKKNNDVLSSKAIENVIRNGSNVGPTEEHSLLHSTLD